jgi:hypothetical protein
METRLIPLVQATAVNKDLRTDRLYKMVREGKLAVTKIQGRMYVREADIIGLKVRPCPWLRAPDVEAVVTYRFVEAPKPEVAPQPEPKELQPA